MKCGFVTCVGLGLACMEEIYEAGGSLDLAMTLPDHRARDKSGRIYPDEFCAEHEIPLVKVPNINDEAAIQAVKSHEIDWLFIIGWSQIAHPPMLEAPLKGALGMHPTLLPEGRGRAAIPWAIIKGLPETGVTLFKLDQGVDTGPILAQERLKITSDDTASTLYERVAAAHRNLIRRVWPDLINDRLKLQPQVDSEATVWPGRKPEDGRISSEMKIEEVERLVRATTHPYPGAFRETQSQVLRIWQGRIGDAHQPPAEGAYRIALSNGVYDALDYTLE